MKTDQQIVPPSELKAVPTPPKQVVDVSFRDVPDLSQIGHTSPLELNQKKELFELKWLLISTVLATVIGTLVLIALFV